jgi:hypothetical protein
MASAMTQQTIAALVTVVEPAWTVGTKTVTRVTCKMIPGTRGARLDELAPLTNPTALAVTSVAATDIFTNAGNNGFVAGDQVCFAGLVGGAGLVAMQTYWVIAANLAATTFQVSATQGGASFDHTTNVTAGSVFKGGAHTLDFYLSDEAGAVTLPAVGDTFNVVMN